MKKIMIIFLMLLITQSMIALNSKLEPVKKAADQAQLKRLSAKFYSTWLKTETEIKTKTRNSDIPRKIETANSILEIAYFNEKGNPVYYTTTNADAASTISTSHVHQTSGNGYTLTGSGINIHQWDAGNLNENHQEYSGRVTAGDVATSNSDHSAHIAGTMIASGIDVAAKGMAYQGHLNYYDWNNATSEMAIAASNGAILSNHSYGYRRGWYWYDASHHDRWLWSGDADEYEERNFGLYNTLSEDFDKIAYAAPYYQIVVSAGNNRDDGPGDNNDHPDDGDYDSISDLAIAKNTITVGSVNDISGEYTQPSDVVMTDYSGWGPCDDGRIKPDIVANGESVYSSTYDQNTYATSSGTSMATASVTGSLALVQEQYYNINSEYMRASTLKGLLAHCADEAGDNIGPDYQHGWGLMNTQRMVDHIINEENTAKIMQLSLSNSNTFSLTLPAAGDTPLKVTICWTDPAGEVITTGVDPSDIMLVNDLDLRITEKSNTYYPWKLDKDNPQNAATNYSDNSVDNIEQIYLSNPQQENYTITITHKDQLVDDNNQIGYQDFALIISGIAQGVPSCSITSPSSGDIIEHGESVNISAEAEVPDGQISDVKFYINDQLHSTDTSSPYNYTWDTTFENYGSNEIKALATSNSGIVIIDTKTITLSEPFITYYENDFSTSTGWSATGGTNNWLITDPSTPSDDHTGNGSCFMTNGDNDYGNSETYILTSPAFDLSLIDNTNGSFWMWLDAEDTQTYYDGAFVQIYNNNQWTSVSDDLLSLDYDGPIDDGYNNAYIDESAWTYDRQAWTKVNIDLSSFNNADFAIRFIYATDSSEIANGWAIDDFAITGTELAQAPGTASNFFPIDNTTNIPQRVTLDWRYSSAIGDLPTGFKLYKDSALIADIPFAGNVFYTHTLSNLPYNTQFTWKVVPYNEGGDCETTTANNFHTMLEPIIPNSVNSVTVGAVIEHYSGTTPPLVVLPEIELTSGLSQPAIELTFASNVTNANIIYQIQNLPDVQFTNPEYCAAVMHLSLPSDITTQINLQLNSTIVSNQVLYYNGSTSTWEDITTYSSTPTFGPGSASFNWTPISRGDDSFMITKGGDSELPVELASFTAQIVTGNVTLNWRTMTEHNSYGWNVYKSTTTNISDAIQLNNYAIPAQGFSSEPTIYNYDDTNEFQIETEYWYWLESISLNGESEFFEKISVLLAEEEESIPEIPYITEIGQNFPNPFNPSTNIQFSLEVESEVAIEIYNSKGQRVIKFDIGTKSKGSHSVFWNGLDYKSQKVSSGIYFFKMTAGDYVGLKKGLLLK